MVKLTGLFSRLGKIKILVAGDLMLDCYTFGEARRLSPEAPVPVIQVTREQNLPGGAGNVMLNLVSFGAEVTALGRVGNDALGMTLIDELKKNGIDVQGIRVDPHYSTPLKTRVIASNQQLVRIDYEKASALTESFEDQLIQSLPSLIADVQIVAISDYGKGFLSKTLLNHLIELAKTQNIPVIVDPKGIDFSKYAGATIIKPNQGEAYAAAGLSADFALEAVAHKIFERTQCEHLFITRSEEGIALFNPSGPRFDFPAQVREVKDVTGAGDTVLAMLTFAIGNGLTLQQAAQLANICAGISVEHLGCARISLAELAERLLRQDTENKIFDQEHLFALKEALAKQDFIILSVQSQEVLTASLFKSIRSLKTHHNQLLIYIRDEEPHEDFLHLISSIQDIDFILVGKESLSVLIQEIQPIELYHFNQNRLHKVQVLSSLFI